MGFAIKVAPTDRVFQPSMALGLFEPHVMAAVRAYARPGSVAIDAFGHVGYFTLMLAQAVGPEGGVETYECDPRLAPRIAQHVSVNDMSGIVNVNEVAVWDVDGEEVELKIVEMPGWSYLEEGMWEPVATVRVPSVTCDEHLRRRNIDPATVSFVKLDVEGAEVRARPVWNGCSARATPQS
ncbi:MAG: FkbM family methyltransferase [Solirubrobacterales bacterium]